MRHAERFAGKRAAVPGEAGQRQRLLGPLLAVLVGVAGCATPAPPPAAGPSDAFTLSADDTRLAGALARYAEGVLIEETRGSGDPAAVAAFEDAAALDPTRRRIYSRLALGHLMRREPDAAIAALESSAREHPDDPDVLTDLAVTCQLTGHLDRAVTHYEAALRIAPDNAAVYAALVRIHVEEADDAAAAETLRRGLAACDNPPVLVALALVRGQQLVESNALDAALPYVEALLASNAPGRTGLLTLAGQIHFESGRRDRALTCFRAAAAAPDADPDTFVRYGAACAACERTADGIAVLEEGRQRFPDSLALVDALAVLYNQAARPADAFALYEAWRDAFEAADSARPLPRRFYMAYAYALARAGRPLKAETLLAECIAAHPDAADALNYLAYTWAEQDENLEEAEAYARRALAIEPGNGAYLDTLGWVRYRRGDYPGALDAVRRADTAMPDDPVITEHLGDINDALGNRDAAVAAWTRSLRLEPANPGLRLKLDASGVDPDSVLEPPAPGAAAANEPPPST